VEKLGLLLVLMMQNLDCLVMTYFDAIDRWSGFPSIRIDVLQTVEQEYVCVQLDDTRVVVCCIYSPPKIAIKDFNTVSESLDFISDLYPGVDFYITGWRNDSCCSLVVPTDNCSSPAAEILFNICASHHLFQLNQFLNSRETLLDLILSHRENILLSLADDALKDSTSLLLQGHLL